ncbi:1-aminocyclopropane-1-carboxylate deaminase/D-cysteine desulfhydrase [Thiomicrorhabdus chilensis]|uniref:1-aminocyclopropane-1-carboxylate deaminase/D-cysteine desulfhydrase n=1 Tax=Thiomicrorhabdus chilensis TaxID=63656 RepID=UPI0004278811|nr:pyridoxal-phosphate dependent enzyme [Thiomicrorhabdus chilensis]
MTANFSEKPTPLTELHDSLFERRQIRVWIKRDDLNHPLIQGNKWHKLKYNLQAAKKQGKSTLLTFGGAYSNHIAATAYAAKSFDFQSVGMIRGDELAGKPERWSPTLKTAHQNGMQLKFLSRQSYRLKASPDFLDELKQQQPDAYVLPEGGSNDLAIKGFEPLMQELEQQSPNWTHLLTATGTGGTLAGLIKYAKNHPDDSTTRLIQGVAVLKQGEALLPQIRQWLNHKSAVKWQLLTLYHDGGYAKLSNPLQILKSQFESQHQIPLDPVYTIKMIHAFYQQVEQGAFPSGSQIILLHTGGLQGNAT